MNNSVDFLLAPDESSSAGYAEPFAGVCAPAATPWPDYLTGQHQSPIRVVVIDRDDYLHRKILREIAADSRVSLVGEANSVLTGRSVISRTKFDVLIVDSVLGDGEGFDLIHDAKSTHEKCEVIVISAVEDKRQVVRALQMGATGFLIKNAPFQSFVDSVLQVVNGGAAVTPRLARRLFLNLSNGPDVDQAEWNEQKPIPLSVREREVLRLIAAGHASQQIGTILLISGQTVNSHVKNIYKKLDVHSRAHAVSLATSRNFI